ncbi:MAG: hypothetical protein KAR20_02080 [Candidatus Heimdallarchaeota archaeon]|nr:hypothetical protein [Candidatus Heimdallarchaeota archaeon]
MKDNPNEKIKQRSEVHWGTDDYCIIKINVDDGQEPYYFAQVMKNGGWEYILCNVYCGKKGIENIYTTKELRVNFGSSHKYSEIGCHQEEFAHELIKCHEMGLSKYMAEKKAERLERESRRDLDELSLDELHSLHDLLDRGIVDGNSGHTIEIEGRGCGPQQAKWQKLGVERAASLVKIRRAIRLKAKKIDY